MKLYRFLKYIIQLLIILKELYAYRDWDNIPSQSIDNVLHQTNACASIIKQFLQWDLNLNDNPIFILTKEMQNFIQITQKEINIYRIHPFEIISQDNIQRLEDKLVGFCQYQVTQQNISIIRWCEHLKNRNSSYSSQDKTDSQIIELIGVQYFKGVLIFRHSNISDSLIQYDFISQQLIYDIIEWKPQQVQQGILDVLNLIVWTDLNTFFPIYQYSQEIAHLLKDLQNQLIKVLVYHQKQSKQIYQITIINTQDYGILLWKSEVQKIIKNQSQNPPKKDCNIFNNQIELIENSIFISKQTSIDIYQYNIVQKTWMDVQNYQFTENNLKVISTWKDDLFIIQTEDSVLLISKFTQKSIKIFQNKKFLALEDNILLLIDKGQNHIIAFNLYKMNVQGDHNLIDNAFSGQQDHPYIKLNSKEILFLENSLRYNIENNKFEEDLNQIKILDIQLLKKESHQYSEAYFVMNRDYLYLILRIQNQIKLFTQIPLQHSSLAVTFDNYSNQFYGLFLVNRKDLFFKIIKEDNLENNGQKQFIKQYINSKETFSLIHTKKSFYIVVDNASFVIYQIIQSDSSNNGFLLYKNQVTLTPSKVFQIYLRDYNIDTQALDDSQELQQLRIKLLDANAENLPEIFPEMNLQLKKDCLILSTLDKERYMFELLLINENLIFVSQDICLVSISKQSLLTQLKQNNNLVQSKCRYISNLEILHIENSIQIYPGLEHKQYSIISISQNTLIQNQMNPDLVLIGNSNSFFYDNNFYTRSIVINPKIILYSNKIVEYNIIKNNQITTDPVFSFKGHLDLNKGDFNQTKFHQIKEFDNLVFDIWQDYAFLFVNRDLYESDNLLKQSDIESNSNELFLAHAFRLANSWNIKEILIDIPRTIIMFYDYGFQVISFEDYRLLYLQNFIQMNPKQLTIKEYNTYIIVTSPSNDEQVLIWKKINKFFQSEIQQCAIIVNEDEKLFNKSYNRIIKTKIVQNNMIQTLDSIKYPIEFSIMFFYSFQFQDNIDQIVINTIFSLSLSKQLAKINLLMVSDTKNPIIQLTSSIFKMIYQIKSFYLIGRFILEEEMLQEINKKNLFQLTVKGQIILKDVILSYNNVSYKFISEDYILLHTVNLDETQQIDKNIEKQEVLNPYKILVQSQVTIIFHNCNFKFASNFYENGFLISQQKELTTTIIMNSQFTIQKKQNSPGFNLFFFQQGNSLQIQLLKIYLTSQISSGLITCFNLNTLKSKKLFYRIFMSPIIYKLYVQNPPLLIGLNQSYLLFIIQQILIIFFKKIELIVIQMENIYIELDNMYSQSKLIDQQRTSLSQQQQQIITITNLIFYYKIPYQSGTIFEENSIKMMYSQINSFQALYLSQIRIIFETNVVLNPNYNSQPLVTLVVSNSIFQVSGESMNLNNLDIQPSILIELRLSNDIGQSYILEGEIQNDLTLSKINISNVTFTNVGIINYFNSWNIDLVNSSFSKLFFKSIQNKTEIVPFQFQSKVLKINNSIFKLLYSDLTKSIISTRNNGFIELLSNDFFGIKNPEASGGVFEFDQIDSIIVSQNTFTNIIALKGGIMYLKNLFSENLEKHCLENQNTFNNVRSTFDDTPIFQFLSGIKVVNITHIDSVWEQSQIEKINYNTNDFHPNTFTQFNQLEYDIFEFKPANKIDNYFNVTSLVKSGSKVLITIKVNINNYKNLYVKYKDNNSYIERVLRNLLSRTTLISMNSSYKIQNITFQYIGYDKNYEAQYQAAIDLTQLSASQNTISFVLVSQDIFFSDDEKKNKTQVSYVNLVQTLNNFQQILSYNQYSKKRIIIKFTFRNCKRGEIKIVQSDGSIICYKCPQGMYSVKDPNLYTGYDLQCLTCPNDKTYPQSCYSNQIFLKEGYWRPDDNSDTILECTNNPSSCLGEEKPQNCLKGYDGPLCQSCNVTMKYGKQGLYNCISCDDNKAGLVLFPFSILGFLLIYTFLFYSTIKQIKNSIYSTYLRKGRIFMMGNSLSLVTQFSAYIKILIFFWQIVFWIKSFNLEIQKEYYRIFESFLNIQITSGNSLNFIYLQTDCIIEEITDFNEKLPTFYVKTLIVTLIPLLLIFGVLLVLSICKLFMKHFPVQLYLSTSYYFIFVLFQSNILFSLTQAISCHSIIEAHYIIADMQYQCYTKQYWINATWIIPLILIVGFIIPIIIIYQMQKSQADPIQKIKNSFKFQFLSKEYKQKYFFWEFLRGLIKNLAMLIISLLPFKNSVKCIIIIMLLLSYRAAISKLDPFLNRKVSLTELKCVYILIMIFFGVLIMCIEREAKTSESTLFIISLVIISILSILLSVQLVWKIIVLSTFKYNQKLVNLKNKFPSLCCILKIKPRQQNIMGADKAWKNLVKYFSHFNVEKQQSYKNLTDYQEPNLSHLDFQSNQKSSLIFNSEEQIVQRFSINNNIEDRLLQQKNQLNNIV